MSLTRQFLHEFRPLFRMLEEPIIRSPAYFGGGRVSSLFDDPLFHNAGRLRPAVDLHEEGDKYIVEAELPGVRKEDVQVSVGEGGRSLIIEGNVASRRAQLSQAEDAKDATVSNSSTTEGATDSTCTTSPEMPRNPLTSNMIGSTTNAVAPVQPTQNQLSAERVFTRDATFTRTVYLPRQVDGSRVTAKLQDGVLTLMLPKAEDRASVKVDVQ
jgi:HSP20 family molecular chaperone IbpA